MSKKIKLSHIKFCPIVGFGYWADKYKEDEIGIGGITHNIILPFIRIQFGYLISTMQ